MYISIPSYASPFSATPLKGAIGFISLSNFDHAAGTGRVELSIYPDRPAADAGLPPIAKRGYPIPATDPSPDGPFGLPSLKTIEADNAATFAALVQIFYGLLLADPALAGATPA